MLYEVHACADAVVGVQVATAAVLAWEGVESFMEGGVLVSILGSQVRVIS